MGPSGSFRLIQAFHRVIATGSFTEAAARLSVSQPAVSQQIRELETILGVELFRRTGRGVTPTAAGAQLAASTGEPLAAIERGLAAIRARAQDHHVEVRVNSTFATTWLVPRLPTFLAAHPGVEIDLSSSYWLSPTDPIHTSVLIDFGTIPDGAEPIGGVETVIAVAAPSVARRVRSVGELGDHPLLDIRGGDGWAQFLAATEHPMPNTIVHTSMTYLHTLELARVGLGVALGHRFVVADDVRRDRLAIVDVGEMPAREQYYLIPPPPDRATSAARSFTAWLREELRRPSDAQ